jgi:hypothetical protein
MEYKVVILEQIDDCISQLLQLEYRDNQEKACRAKDIHDARKRAEGYSFISRLWDEWGQDAEKLRDPSYKNMCNMEANYFRERAELEEAHAIRRLEFENKYAQLKHHRSELLAELFARRDKASTTTPIESNY